MEVRQAHGGDAEATARLLGELGYPTPPYRAAGFAAAADRSVRYRKELAAS
jgi:hypothetical protein